MSNTSPSGDWCWVPKIQADRSMLSECWWTGEGTWRGHINPKSRAPQPMAGSGFYQGTPSFSLDLRIKHIKMPLLLFLLFFQLRIPSFIAKKLFLISFYLMVIYFSSYQSQVLSMGTAQDFRSLCPFGPQRKWGTDFFSCVTSLQHELPRVLQPWFAACSACMLELIIFD